MTWPWNRDRGKRRYTHALFAKDGDKKMSFFESLKYGVIKKWLHIKKNIKKYNRVGARS
jgi:hypothetical protein